MLDKLWRGWVAATAALRGGDRRLSFSKLMATAILAAYSSNRPVPQVVAVALLAASFGAREFRAFLSRSSFTAVSTESTAVKREILARRNGEYEATP